MGEEEKLRDYKQKRDFSKTTEPEGRGRKTSDSSLFVIQKHAASSLHYDFRLEVEGVLKSWAVPKGPSTDPRDKRLAVPTEDHPLEYADFEGVIPAGEYGAGTVLIWDEGTYRNLKEQGEKPVGIEEALARGHLTVWLEGKKLRGGYALTRFRTGKDEAWLLVKMDDPEADARRNPVQTEPKSVRTGRDLEGVAAAESPKTTPNRA